MNILKRILCLGTAFAICISLISCGKNEEVSKDEVSSLVNVTVSRVKKGDIDETIKYTGEVKSRSSASVSAKVSGSVSSIHAEVGDYVTQGTVLMTIDSAQYTLAYNQASAAYQSAQAALGSAEASYRNVSGGSLEQSKISMNQALDSAESNYNTALDNYNRQKALFDIGAVSKVALDSAKTALDNARIAFEAAQANTELNESVVIPETKAGANAALSQAKAGISQAKAALDIAKSNLANCTVTAPISGYIASKNVSVGQMASPGIELFSIKDADDLEAEINVTESVISSVRPSSVARVSVKSAGAENIAGTVTTVANAKNDMTGMYLVKVAIPNQDGKIKVGMMADVSIVTNGAKDILVVDSGALIYKNDKYYVYVAQDGKAIKKEVTVGASDGKNTQIISGLSKGEDVIVEGKEFVSEKNNEIRIVK